MKIKALPFTIYRDKNSGKKLYKYNGSTQNTLPEIKWTTLPTLTSKVNLLNYSFAIIPEHNLVVIDCDSMEATDKINSVLDSLDITTFTVVSDKGFKHFYFRPSDYSREKIVSKNRVKFGDDIDYLQGNSMVFGFGIGNATKNVDYVEPFVYPDPTNITGKDLMSELTPQIPDRLVDELLAMNTNSYSSNSSHANDMVITSDNFKDMVNFSRLKLLGAKVREWLKRYNLTKSFEDFRPIIAEYCPYSYKKYLEPTYHPNNIPDGSGINFLQALTAKLGADPSISLEQAEEIITIIATRLWENPLPEDNLEQFIKYIPKQSYPDGSPVFIYDANALKNNITIVTPSKNTYFIFNTIDGYVITGPNFTQRHKTARSLKSQMVTLGDVYVNSLRVDRKVVLSTKFNTILEDKVQFVTILNSPKYPMGLSTVNDTLVYNTFIHSDYDKIVNGELLKEVPKQKRSRPKAITTLFHSIMYDNKENIEKLALYFDYFIAHKLKTNMHSPLLFHLIGAGGTGKDTLIEYLLKPLFNSVGYFDISTADRFNAHFIDKRIILVSEVQVRKRVKTILKQLSGSATVSIEAKGLTPYNSDNVGTYFMTSNEANTLAETAHDRRVVVFSSFLAPRLQLANPPKQLGDVLIEYALYLRDLDMPDTIELHNIYTNATAWPIQNTLETQTEVVSESTSYIPQNTVSVIFTKLQKLNTKNITKDSVADVYASLTNADMMYRLSKSSGNYFLYIPAMHKKAYRLSDNAPLNSQPTKAMMQQVGYDVKSMYRNNKLKQYSHTVYEAKFIISEEAYNYIKELEMDDAQGKLEEV